jgi:hypothetical protein
MVSGPEQIYARVFRTLKPRARLPEIRVEIRRYANANAQVLLAGGVLRVRMADTLASAPETVQEALAEILLAKLFRRPVPRDSDDRYRRYLNRHDVRRSLDQVRSKRGRKHFDPPAGRHYDLLEVFEEMNFRYFFGLMARPALGWSRRPSRTLLGHYDPSHHAIVLSRLLDSPEVPRFVVEYVMFHEMLHLRHPEQHAGARRCIHTVAFKQEERRFERLREAKAWLRGLV